jgi:hypothetical protein
MTEIIPGLQGDIPSNSWKGVPYVGGKYELYDKFFFFFFLGGGGGGGGVDAEVWAFDREIKTELHYRRLNHGRYAVQLLWLICSFSFLLKDNIV